MDPLRRSRSTTTTRLPAMPMLAAMLAEMKVLPMPGSRDVIIITLPPEHCSLLPRNSILALNRRNDSDILSWSWLLTTMARSSSFVRAGISQRNGTVVALMMSLWYFTLVSSRRRRKKIATGTSRPIRRPNRVVLVSLGATGVRLMRAGSRTLPLGSMEGWLIISSSRRLNRCR